MIMEKEIYYVGFPGVEMMTHAKPVPFEVLEVSKDTLRIRLLEDCPTEEGFSEEDLPRSMQEFTIKNSLRNGDSLIDRLRSGGVAPYYTSEGKHADDYFAGTLFGYDPSKRNP